MISTTTLAAFAAAALAIIVLPGPAIAYLVTRSVDQGRRVGMVSLLGVHTGSVVHVTAAVLGLSAVLASSATAFTVIKYLGAAYLVYLGVRTLLERGDHALEAGGTRRTVPLGRAFGQGVMVEVFNPKTALFFLGFFPQFVDPSAGAVPLQIAELGALWILAGVLVDGGYVLLASGLGRLLRRSVRFNRVVRYLSGGTYLGLGAYAAVSGGRTS